MEAKGWKVLEPGSATGLNAHWEGSVTKGKGAFGYYWTPTSFVGRLNLVGPLSAEVGFAGDDNWTKCIASQTDELCADAQPSQWPSSKTGTIFERYYYIFNIEELIILICQANFKIIDNFWDCGNEIFIIQT